MVIVTIKDAIREARAANRRAVSHRARWGTNDASGRLYHAHEFAQRDAAMAWARRYQLAMKQAAGCSDRQLVATINSTAKCRAMSVEIRAFRQEANRRRTRLAA